MFCFFILSDGAHGAVVGGHCHGHIGEAAAYCQGKGFFHRGFGVVVAGIDEEGLLGLSAVRIPWKNEPADAASSAAGKQKARCSRRKFADIGHNSSFGKRVRQEKRGQKRESETCRKLKKISRKL